MKNATAAGLGLLVGVLTVAAWAEAAWLGVMATAGAGLVAAGTYPTRRRVVRELEGKR